MRIEHHLLRLARIGPDEHHAAVAKPDMGDLHGHRRAVEQHDLVAPVELVGLARREQQRHIGLRRPRTARLQPAPGIAPDRVVPALVAEPSKLLVDADQRQPLSLWLVMVAVQKRIELPLPGPNLRLGLSLTLIGERRRIGAQNLANGVPRQMQFAADLLERPPLDMKSAPNPGQSYPPTSSPLHPLKESNGWSQNQQTRGVKIARR